MRALVQFFLTILFRLKEFISGLNQSSSELPVVADYYPGGLGIEVTNLCNANCTFCGYQYRERPLTFMSQTTFEKIIHDYVDMNRGEDGIGLTPIVGDPLLDREIDQKIEYARSFPQIKNIHLTTNGIALSKALFEKLVDAGLNFLTVSMSGFDAEEYRRIYRNPAYERVMENLRAIAGSDRLKQCYVEIALRTDSLFPWLKKEYWEFRSYGFTILRNWFFDNWSGRIKDRDLSGFMFLRPEVRSKRIPCAILYVGPHVLSDGTVTACGCRDLEGTSELKLGNIHEQPLREILNHGKMEALRQRFMDGNLPDICRDCKFYNPMTVPFYQDRMTKQPVLETV